MRADKTLRFALVLLFAIAAELPRPAAAVTLQTDDGCGTSNIGTLTGTLSADSNGNVTVQGFNNNKWMAGQGSCETALAAGAAPRCSLIVSETNAEPNVPVTFHARCRTPAGAPVTSYTWIGPQGGPALPANASTSNNFTLSFPSKGAYSYVVQGTNANGMGPTSTPATVLVGNPAVTTDGPTCNAVFSPATIIQHQTSQFLVSCQPGGTSIAWDAPDANAPAGSGFLPVLTFPAPGVFTYKVRVANASGTYGPKIGATINVISDGSCVPGPVVAQYTIPGSYTYSSDATAGPNQVVAFSLSVASTSYAQVYLQNHSAYTTYTYPNAGVIAISKCPGDFNVPTACQSTLYSSWSTMLPATNSAYSTYGYCNLDPGVAYYINVKPTDCSNSPTGLCGFKIYRGN